MNTILFISTNATWGGSEIVWARYARYLTYQNCTVLAAAKYDNLALSFLKENFINYQQPVQYSRAEKLLHKLKIKKLRQRNILEEFISQAKPDLVVISQGDNAGSLAVMQHCSRNKIKFITITQLVSPSFFTTFKNENLQAYRDAYKAACKNFFVSKQNLQLTQDMLGIELPNAETMLNPCTVQGETLTVYPAAETYSIALAGRLECFQKGYDILLNVLACEKWQSRSIHFNIYGNGQHLRVLKDNIERLHIQNVLLHPHTDSIKNIWQQNHLLCMPSRAEGQSLALIEAMYFARAAVVTDVGGAAELVIHGVTGFIAESPSVKSLDAALEAAWEKRNEWEAMGKAASKCIMETYKVPAETLFYNQVRQIIETGQ